jgi:Zn-dependent protease
VTRQNDYQIGAVPEAVPSAAPPQRRSGSIHLFRLFGIDVYLHWLWFLMAWYEVTSRRGQYGSVAWNIAEYVTLFLIVLLHEFGHALACKSVGGKAERITLWPLGGVAFVQPPQRPGAWLWSIAAGPLVNVILLPITWGIYFWIQSGAIAASPDLRQYVLSVATINVVLLVFNMLPIYPLDGGQILRALLWFVIGRARSLIVASVIGLLGALAVIALAIYLSDVWLILLALFGFSISMQGIAQARAIQRMSAVPRHEDIHCPGCAESPPAGPFWGCQCGARFDAFDHAGICPHCGKPFETTVCPHCGRRFAYSDWVKDRQVAPRYAPAMSPVQSATIPPPPPPPPSPPAPASFDTSKYFP